MASATSTSTSLEVICPDKLLLANNVVMVIMNKDNFIFVINEGFMVLLITKALWFEAGGY